MARVYIVMAHGKPCAAFSSKKSAWDYSVEIGGPGIGHAIAIVALELDDPKRMPTRGDTPPADGRAPPDSAGARRKEPPERA